MPCGTASPGQGWSQGLSGASRKTCLGKVAVTLKSLQACLGLAGTSIQQGGVGGGEWQGQLKGRQPHCVVPFLMTLGLGATVSEGKRVLGSCSSGQDCSIIPVQAVGCHLLQD